MPLSPHLVSATFLDFKETLQGWGVETAGGVRALEEGQARTGPQGPPSLHHCALPPGSLLFSNGLPTGGKEPRVDPRPASSAWVPPSLAFTRQGLPTKRQGQHRKTLGNQLWEHGSSPRFCGSQLLWKEVLCTQVRRPGTLPSWVALACPASSELQVFFCHTGMPAALNLVREA